VNIELIILAAIAVLVISRLYSVLGQKTGAEPTPRRVKEAMNRPAETGEPAEEGRPRVRPAFTGPAAAGLESIAATDPDFSPDDFTRGARKAYEMIVTAFADGDRETLRELVDEDVYEAYSTAIDERQTTGAEPLRLARIRAARIAEASVSEDGMARVAVSFESELTDGDLQRHAKEIWTFKRPVNTSNPNWLLDEVAVAS
jgi:predicted lipid-binding transport protein (Tim44 family)